MMSKLRKRFIDDLQLRGYSEKTVTAYVSAVKHFANHFNQSPARLGTEEIREYLLYLIKVKKASDSLIRQSYSGLKLLYEVTLGRTWDERQIPRSKKASKLPVVMDKTEVLALFAATDNLKHRALLMTIYSAGLRVSEALNLKIEDIDSKRMQLHVRHGKGKRERYATLSRVAYEVLRQYWREYKFSEYLFPGQNGDKPLDARSVQAVVRRSARKAGIKKHVTTHTLRHSYATHMLEAGNNLHHLQLLLGHKSIGTTTRYLHVTRKDLENITSPLDLA